MANDLRGRDRNLKLKAKTLAVRMKQDSKDLGAALAEIDRQRLWQDWGYESFAQYCEALELSKPAARALIRKHYEII